MLTGKKIILVGAGIHGCRALDYFGFEKVYCFADNNKAGQTCFGKQVISVDELSRIHDDFDVVLSVGRAFIDALEKQCNENGIRYRGSGELLSHEGYRSNPAIKQFENKHKGERCFLIGNGPSLTAEDLTKLHENKEITFGCNAINKIFDQTPWRPVYFMATDPLFFLFQNEMLADTEAGYKFFPKISADRFPDADIERIRQQLDLAIGQVFFFQPITPVLRRNVMLRFSPDASKAIYCSTTVMYSMFQLATYMGFSEIFLLGVDGGAVSLNNPVEYLSETRHFYQEDENLIFQYSSRVEMPDTEHFAFYTAMIYEQIEKHALSHELRIRNATRAGTLTAFERVEFDSLFNGDGG